MKTIELKSAEQIAQFTTRSVTFDDKEFYYSKMSDLTHNPEGLNYSFTYDGEAKVLPYEAKDAPVLNAIFSQVIKLHAAKAASAASEDVQDDSKAAASDKAPADVPEDSDVKQASRSDTAEEPAAGTSDTPEPDESADIAAESNESAEISSDSDVSDEPAADSEDKTGESDVDSAESTDDTAAKDEEAKDDAQTAPAAAKIPELNAEEKSNKKIKLKKSLLIFIVVLIVIGALAVAGYFIFGIGKEPANAGPGSTESQQYDDIDELINDL